MLTPMATGFFGTLEDTVPQRVLQTSANQVFWKENLPVLPRALVWLVQVFSDKLATTVEIFALVTYPFHVVLLNFSEGCMKRLTQSRHALVAFLLVESAWSDEMRESDVGGVENQYMVLPCPWYWMLKNRCM